MRRTGWRAGLPVLILGMALATGVACAAPAAAPSGSTPPPSTGAAPSATAPGGAAPAATATPASNLRAQTPADTLVVGAAQTTDTLHPMATTSFLFPEPYYYRPIAWRDDKYEPQLATWRYTDPSTLQLTLKDGLRYQDGTPVRAQDMKFSFDFTMNPENVIATQLRQIFTGLVSMDVVDDKTVNVRASSPDPLIHAKIYRLPVVSEAWFNSRTPEQLASTTNGAGPYRVAEFLPRERMALERNPNASTQPPQAKITVVFLPDAAAREAALRSGQIDHAEEVGIDTGINLKRDGFQILEATRANGITFGMVPTGDSPFADLRVRQATDMAVDRRALAESLFSGAATVLEAQPAVPGIVGYDPSIRAVYDPARARQLLAEAGMAGGMSVPFRYTPAVPQWGPAAEAVAGMLNAVGIRTQLESIELAVWFQRGAQNPNGNGPLYMGQSAFIVADASYHLGFWRTPNNRGFSNAEFDRLMNEQALEQNPQRREQLLQQATKIMVDDKVFSYLVAPKILVAAYPNVKGLNMGVVSTQVLELMSK